MKVGRWASLWAAASLLFLLLLRPPAVDAAVTVPSTQFPTIQSAINAVLGGALPNGTVINVKPGTYRETLAANNTAKSFTVRGAGPTLTRITAAGLGQSILSMTNATGAVRFEALSLMGTGVSGPRGGGFTLVRASPTFANCLIEGNAAPDGGGGILFASNARFESCIIRNNRASRFAGGVLMVAGSRPTFLMTTIAGNQSGVASSVGSGGGVHANDSSPTFIGSSITGNQSRFAAGGIFVLGRFGSPNGPATLVMQDSVVANNTTSRFSPSSNPAEGGGIHIEDNAIARLTRVAIRGNAANTGGGLNSFRGRYEVTGSMIESNQALDPQAVGGAGGGALVIGALVLTDSVVRNNVARTAGGVAAAGQPSCGSGGTCATLVMSDSLVDGNASTRLGGGIHVARGTGTIQRSQVFRNRVNGVGAFGGGVFSANANVSITDSAIADNSASALGGGVFVDKSVVNITHSVIYRNSATTFGGGLFVNGGSPASTGTVQQSILADNTNFQIHEAVCAPATAPFLTYLGNTIVNQVASDLYRTTCYPPLPITSIGAFNALPRSDGNNSDPPVFASFTATPALSPSVLAWTVARATTVSISGVGQVSAPTGSQDVSPPCTTSYVLTADTLNGSLTATVHQRRC
jgi:hypothetical protein